MKSVVNTFLYQFFFYDSSKTFSIYYFSHYTFQYKSTNNSMNSLSNFIRQKLAIVHKATFT